MRWNLLDYVQQDSELHRVIAPALPGLERLSAEQLETLIFFLKSIHNHYPENENDVDHYATFSDKLSALRNTKEQKELERTAARKLLMAMAVGGLAFLFLGLGVVLLIGGETSLGGGLVAAAIGSFLLAEARFGRPALVAAKEQDRRYFLQSLRLARGCNELDWAGLFAYNGVTQPGPQSDDDMERTQQRIAELSSQLRNALYNDDYMSYSHERPDLPAAA